jgi:hypothetical protein
MKNLYKIEDELYIVSNTEGVSENCWIITSGKLVQVSYLLSDEVAKGFKVILTTNKLLIKDSVQAIDDEFLVWFVKNPSCERVEVYYQLHKDEPLYRIIIPKEEPKQIYYNTVGRENGVNVVKGQFNTQKEALDLANELNRKFPDLYYDWRETLIKEEPKQIKCYCGHTITCDCEPLQETLEEAAEDNAKKVGHYAGYQDFIKGAKWQQERMYSEEDMIATFHYGHQIGMNNVLAIQSQHSPQPMPKSDVEALKKEWFEQFKKK